LLCVSLDCPKVTCINAGFTFDALTFIKDWILLLFPRNRPCRTGFETQSAFDAIRFDNLESYQGRAHPRRTDVLMNMRLIFFRKIAQCG
jgi:hypothetical protein